MSSTDLSSAAAVDRPRAPHAVAQAVALGLGAERKSLPSWLLYDAAGSALFDRITRLPEYYLTRAEAEILRRHGHRIVERASEGGARLSLAELGAGTATKTQALLEAAVRAQRSCVYLACDIAELPVRRARLRLQAELPAASVRIFIGTHAQAAPAIAALPERQVVLWLGSSIGNYPDAEASALLAELRRSLRPDAVLVFGTDLVKDPRVLVRAYDDARGVTAAFSRNLLVRLNRELAAEFDVPAFRHVAEWDARASNIEIHLESRRAERVWVAALGRHFTFARGERIHTETAGKYDAARVDRILRAAGFTRAESYLDARERFAVHLARVA